MKKQIYLTMLAACLCVLTTAQTVIPSYVPTNGLVGWWPFNGNANDLSGNNNNGTVNGATLTADRYGNANKAYNFNGINNYIEVLHSNSLNLGIISISCWINPNALLTTNNFGPIILSKREPSGWGTAFQLTIGNHDFWADWTIGSNGGIYHTDNTNLLINTNTNAHLVYTHDLNKVRLYLNGNLVQEINSPGLISGNTLPLWFGARPQNIQFFNGTIDDIGIWNRVLTPCEVKKLYTSGSFSVSSSVSNTICVGQSLNLAASGANSYTWSTGTTNQSISVSPTVSTVYTVSTTYSAGCTDSRTFSVTVNACTGLNETELTTNSVRIFPNPAKEQLSIMVNNNTVMGKKYSITNALGQVMTTGIFNKQIMELSIQQFSSGLYQLNIDGLQENYKFIKE
jgi:hypothetical protein